MYIQYVFVLYNHRYSPRGMVKTAASQNGDKPKRL